LVCGSLVIRVASATCTSCDNTAHVTYDTIRLTGLSPPPRHSSLMDYLETHKIWVPGRHFSPVPLSEKWSRVTQRPLQPSSRYDMIDMLVWNLPEARRGRVTALFALHLTAGTYATHARCSAVPVRYTQLGSAMCGCGWGESVSHVEGGDPLWLCVRTVRGCALDPGWRVSSHALVRMAVAV
jgi:hypothetical protein